LKILLDHNLDRRLKRSLPDHQTSTTQEEGWADVVNGKLLTLAEASGFDVLLTADANIKSQQNLSRRTISILVLRAYNNRLKTHQEMLPDVNSALAVIRPGEIVEIFHKSLSTR
jgi:predicted nuclease of predicted toxin-antitoxin system